MIVEESTLGEHYFIRLRGRVQGPFDVDRLRQLARRGQFSRLHEVSPDGQQWLPAKDRPELFAAAEAPVAMAAAQPAIAQTTSQHLALGAPVVATPPAEAWFYVEGGKEQGPLERHALASLFATGQLVSETEVWKSGMAEWVPASTIPGLVPVRSASSTTSDRRAQMVEIPEVSADVVRVLVESRPWLVFIGVVTFVYAALLSLAGLAGIVVGSRNDQSAMTMEGFGSLISAAVFCLAGILLMRYANGISQVERRNSEMQLTAALGRLKSFWVFIGILLIVLLVFVLLAVAVAISYTNSFSDI